MAPSPHLLDCLLRVMRDLRAEYDQRAKEIGLTFARARVLTSLLSHEGATQAELAMKIGIEAPTLKRHIAALEAEGYLERRILEGDSRKRALYPTERARNTRTVQYVQRLRAELMEGISLEEQEQVCAILERVAINAEKLGRQ